MTKDLQSPAVTKRLFFSSSFCNKKKVLSLENVEMKNKYLYKTVSVTVTLLYICGNNVCTVLINVYQQHITKVTRDTITAA
jgi:hypothetical protein